jgi:hypothetical protein
VISSTILMVISKTTTLEFGVKTDSESWRVVADWEVGFWIARHSLSVGGF